MTDPQTTLLQTKLDAWGRAEVHAASKLVQPAPPAFTNAVAAEAAGARAIRLGLLVALILVIAFAVALLAVRADSIWPVLEQDPSVSSIIGALSPLVC